MNLVHVLDKRDLFTKGITLLNMAGEELDAELAMVDATSIKIEMPRRKVFFHEQIGIDPFSVFFKGLWTIAGRNDLRFLQQFDRFASRDSEDGHTIFGAVGYRIRQQFTQDQTDAVVGILAAQPNARHAVMALYDPIDDLACSARRSRAKPSLGLSATFRIVEGKLQTVVHYRELEIIDFINSVEWEMLQEYIAARVQCEVGTLTITTSYFYLDQERHGWVQDMPPADDLYDTYQCLPTPLMKMTASLWERDLKVFLEDPNVLSFKDGFFRRTAKPLFHAWTSFLENDGIEKFDATLEILEQMAGPSDWAHAARLWIINKKQAAGYV